MRSDFISAKKLTATERDAIENSISTIMSTPYGTAPFIRGMGIRDYPPKTNSGLARNRYATEAIAQTAMWENRAQVSEVGYTEDNEARVVIRNG
ncbi:MAG: hypothetical protein NC121_18810 [Blautia sp.]|nr:hypothetical protein [Blautia sp.]